MPLSLYNKTVIENILKPVDWAEYCHTLHPTDEQSDKKRPGKPPTRPPEEQPYTVMKPRLAPHEQVRRSIEQTSPGFEEEDPRDNQVITDFNTFVYDEADASEESPSTLPSQKFKYIMTVNNSKLARKHYYK
jgi:hypothetical protein